MKRFIGLFFLVLCMVPLCVGINGCEEVGALHPRSESGATRVITRVQPGTDGKTVEQRNVEKRIQLENLPGSIKHLYVISAYSGQVLLYSTVQGKVTSSGKRLTPTTVHVGDGQGAHRFYGFEIADGRETEEVLGDDGTYGSSSEYLFWFDVKNAYHQHYVSGGQIVHISDQPIAVKSVVLNLEVDHRSPVGSTPPRVEK